MIDPKALEEKLLRERRQTEENDAKRRAEKLGLPYLNLISVRVPVEIKAMRLVPEGAAKKALLAPLGLSQRKLLIAVFDAELEETKKIIKELQEKKYEVNIMVTSLTGLNYAWTYYQYVTEAGKEISGKIQIDENRLEQIQNSIKTFDDLSKAVHEFKSPLTSQILEIILGGSLALKSSDIHFEPSEAAGTLRFRIDGILHTALSNLPLHTYNLLITRIKLLSSLKINITDQPQDGRFTIDLKNRDIEIRTSVIPSEFGETAVMRLLDPLSLKVKLEELGWREDDLAIVIAEVKKPNGLILNTGPTGSGKTTTLYAFLKYIEHPEIKIITVEDPIEYHLEGISQTQVDPDAGYTFASGLRSILRQDPDVILVGEIRDKETAEIALNAALTGHIVFSTLHTNDAVGTIPRLIDLGAKPQILGPALSLVIAQRLIRLLCGNCKKEKEVDKELKNKIEKFLESLPLKVAKEKYANPKIFESKGCERCGNLGYKGRTSIFELFKVDQIMEEAIYKNPTEIELKDLAKRQGMTTMQEDGILKVLLGITSTSEVERLTGPIEWL